MNVNGIGSPVVEAIHRINEALDAVVDEELPDEYGELLRLGYNVAARYLRDGLRRAYAEGFGAVERTLWSEADRLLALELYRQADAVYACIETKYAESERRWLQAQPTTLPFE